MNITARTTKRFLLAAALSIAAAGCGGGDEPTATQPSATSNEAVAGELAGVQLDVRRDPG